MNTCPVFRRSGGHSYGVTVAGPIGSILNPLRNFEEHKTLPFACSLCGSCTDICPVRIDLHQQLFVMRRHLAERKLVSRTKVLGVKAAAAIFRRPWLYRAAGRIGRALMRFTPRWLLYNRWNVWGRGRELPAPPRETFRELHAKRGESTRPTNENRSESPRDNRPLS
jgi:L-lactate dehydrogenase complex protein LldF